MINMRQFRDFPVLLSCVFAVSLAAPAFAEPNTEESEEVSEFVTGLQVAQLESRARGVTGYEVPTRRTDVNRGETVTSRARPEYDPLGVTVGSFILLPSVALEQLYDDNIFDTDNNTEDDFITRVVPRFDLRSNWQNHALNFEGGAAIDRFWDNSDEDTEDYDIGASGRIDIKRSTNVRLRSSYEHTHEDRGSPDDAQGTRPTEIDIYDVGGEFFHNFGTLNGTVGGSFRRLSFDDVNAANGAPIIEHDRDRNRAEGFARVGYEINPSYEVFFRGSYNDIEYDGNEVGTGIDRSSDGYDFRVGLDADFGGIVFGDFYVGYIAQDYDDSTLDDIDGFEVGADITWNVTRLTTAEFIALTDIRQTTQAGASGRLVTTVGFEVDHELLRNLLIGGRASYTRDDFEGINRTDHIYRAGAGVTYLLNRYVHLGANYDLRTRDAEAGGEDFVENVVLVSLRLQY